MVQFNVFPQSHIINYAKSKRLQYGKTMNKIAAKTKNATTNGSQKQIDKHTHTHTIRARKNREQFKEFFNVGSNVKNNACYNSFLPVTRNEKNLLEQKRMPNKNKTRRKKNVSCASTE